MLSTASAGVPDSEIARETTEFARQVYPPFLFNHCVRTFWLADRLASNGLQFDREIVYIAAMLHDVGVLEPYDHGRWFEVDGAQATRDFLGGHAYPTEKVEVVWDAIALHTMTQIAAYKAPKVALVNLGAAADAVGLKFGDPDLNLSGISSSNFLDWTFRIGGVKFSFNLFTNNPLDVAWCRQV